MSIYECNRNHTEGLVIDLGRICPGCFNALMERHDKLLEFVKEIASSGEYCDPEAAINVLKEIGESND